jgi:hypothetical protein
MNMLYGQIYSDFLKHCRPAHAPQPWRRFLQNADAWMPPHDPPATLAALRQKHGCSKLLSSGLAHRDEDGTLSLHEVFYQYDAAIVPLRTMPQGHPFDLLVDEATCSGRLPACAAVQDHAIGGRIAKRGFLFLTFTMRDLLSLRAVGLPAAPAAGLEQLTPQTLGEFRKLAGLAESSHPAPLGQAPAGSSSSPCPTQEEEPAEMPVPQSSDPATAAAGVDHAMVPPRLILVGWTPSTLSSERKVLLDRVVQNLINTGHGLGVGLDQVFVWRPAAAEIRRIKYCLTQGKRKDVVKTILVSLDQSAKPLADSPHAPKSGRTLSETRVRFQEALLRPGSNPAYRRRRLQAFQQAVDRALVEPLLERAADESDPDERSRLAALAALNRLLHPHVELALAKFAKEMTKNGLRGDAAVLDVRDLVKLFDRVYRLTKEKK